MDPLRLVGRPVGLRVRGPSPACAIVVFEVWVSTLDPGHSRGQERGAIDEAVSFTSFGRSILGAPLDRHLFSAEDADSPRAFSDLVEPSPNPVVL